MQAAVYDRPRELRLTELTDPRPGPGEVRLRVRVTGVCGTDVHLHDGEFFPVYPLTPGHEVIGEVDMIGDGAEGLAIGQLVALDNMLTCGLCDKCRQGRPNYCRHLRALGVTDPGGFAEYLVAPAQKCYPVDDLDLDTAVLAEPVACAIHGLDILAMRPGSDVLVLGSGPSGLILTQLLRQSGAGRLTVAAPTEAKLELARHFGADGTVRFGRDDPDAGAALLSEMAPEGFDIVIDATGALGVLTSALGMVRDGGTLFVYGMADEAARLPVSPYDVFRRELTIKGSFAQRFSFDRAVRALRYGRVRSDGLITHRFALASYPQAVETVRNDRTCVKAVVQL
ncbi:MAG: zinc-dependent alcohol dehydrogenase family protein [Acidimicrobiales bacterium]|jgi:D-arabinitol dehydrogenase (NADP+)